MHASKSCHPLRCLDFRVHIHSQWYCTGNITCNTHSCAMTRKAYIFPYSCSKNAVVSWTMHYSIFFYKTNMKDTDLNNIFITGLKFNKGRSRALLMEPRRNGHNKTSAIVCLKLQTEWIAWCAVDDIGAAR